MSSPLPRNWRFQNRRFEFPGTTILMGILNVTPDSFSDGGQFVSPRAAVEQALRLVDQGADLIDIGGESTRPGAPPVPVEEELRRILPVVEAVAAEVVVPLSIDTTKGVVAREALARGASIINDISGLTFDPQMPRICAESQAGVICMHIQGTPQTMQRAPHYLNVIEEVRSFLSQRLEALEQQGVSREAVVIDPGIGFGKTPAHNLALLSNIRSLHELGRPVCIGHSRKRFLKSFLKHPVDERTYATVGISLALAAQGTDLIRIHDVQATRDALLAYRAVLNQPE